MATLEEGLVAFLTADTVLAALIGDGAGGVKLFPESAPQATDYEYVTYQIISAVDEYSLASNVDFPVTRLQIDCWSEGSAAYAKCNAVARAVKNSKGGNANNYRLKEFRGSLGGVDVRGCRLESTTYLLEPPRMGSDLPVRRVSMDFMVSYVEA